MTRTSCVNALNGLTFISTDLWGHHGRPFDGVNALNGLTFISTTEYEAVSKVMNMCQCPQRAYFHFYGSLSEPLILAASESYFCK